MKNTFTFLLVALFGLGAQAQKSYTLYPSVVNVSGSHEEFELVGHGFVKNTSSEDIVITWVRIENDLEANWQSAICDKVTCYGVTVDSASFDLPAGDSSILDLHFYMNDTEGEGTAKLMVWEGDSGGSADTIEYNASTWVSSVSTTKKQGNFSVYPNPTKGVLNLNFHSSENVQVEIVDILGKRLREYNHVGGHSAFDLTDLPNGLYVIRINENGQIQSRTFRKAN